MLCGSGRATADCAKLAGVWSGTWREEQGKHAGELGGTWRFSIAVADCAVSGTADFAGAPGELAGIVCDDSSAEMRVQAEGATGGAKVRFTSATEAAGAYTITVNEAIDAAEPGLSLGDMTGARE